MTPRSFQASTLPQRLRRSALLPLLVALPLLAACSNPGEEAQQALLQLRQQLQPGTAIAQAQTLLQARGITFSLKTSQECNALVKRSRLPTQLPSRGGPCLFGKLPGARAWYGERTDVILQLVFDQGERLVDANLEAIDTYL